MEHGDLQDDLSRCREFLSHESYAEAWELARELFERSPHDAEIVAVYADAAIAAEEPAAALRACRRIRKLGSQDPEILEWQIRAEWDLGLSEPCRESCRQLLAVDPGNYVALDFGLATVLDLADFDRAGDLIDAASRYVEQGPDLSDGEDEESARERFDHLAYQTAVARMMRGEDEWALEAFEEFLEKDPKDPGTYINLMRIHHLAGRYGQARRIHARAMREGLDHEDLHFNMGLALKAEERDREAIHWLARAIRTARQNEAELPDAWFHLGQILRDAGHPRLALWMLARELEVDDTHPAVHAEMAWAAEDLGDYDAAVRMIRAAVERAPEWGVYQHSLAELLLKADGSTEEALAAARRAVELEKDHAAGWQVIGRLAADRGDFEEAESALRRSVQCSDATAEDKGWLGLLLFEKGRVKDAKAWLLPAARAYPFWQPIGEALGRIRGGPLPNRYEIRFAGSSRGGRRWYRVFHVVAESEAAAREAAQKAARGSRGGAAGIVEEEEFRSLGFEVDHAPGIVWDSGRTGKRYPPPPVEDSPDDSPAGS